jgi:multidrug transporter EmrE-like cation transporter
MGYLLLLTTVAAGICGTLATRASRGLRRPVPALVALVSFAAATVGLARLVLTVPVAIVYPVWAGLASVTLLAIDWLVFKEHVRWTHPLGIALVLLGVVLLSGEARP